MPSGVDISFQVLQDASAAFMQALEKMQAKEVLAGFPQEEPGREDAEGNPVPITNAALGYIHNFGSPEQNIPARPFMVEGIEAKRVPIVDGMFAAGKAALDGNSQLVDQALNAVGLIAKTGIQGKINDGPFEPLAESTLKARARRGREGAQEELDRRDAGEAPGVELARPLVDTGQLRNAVEYVIRDARKEK